LSGRAERCYGRAGAWAATLASPVLLPILLLVGSNLFMTFAWHGHLRFKQVPLAGVILASWVITFVEYCMAVPTNRQEVTPDLRLYLARYWGQRFESTSSKLAERSHEAAADAAVPTPRIN
jgi:hypothetical protein